MGSSWFANISVRLPSIEEKGFSDEYERLALNGRMYKTAALQTHLAHDIRDWDVLACQAPVDGDLPHALDFQVVCLFERHSARTVKQGAATSGTIFFPYWLRARATTPGRRDTLLSGK
jgi:hypothetical protein